MTQPVPHCVCGHRSADHMDGTGACHEPSLRCECTEYVELCLKCRHSTVDHNGLNGLCTRIKQRTRAHCGCPQYVTTPDA